MSSPLQLDSYLFPRRSVSPPITSHRPHADSAAHCSCSTLLCIFLPWNIKHPSPLSQVWRRRTRAAALTQRTARTMGIHSIYVLWYITRARHHHHSAHIFKLIRPTGDVVRHTKRL